MLSVTREFGFLAVSECKRVLIVPCRPYPLGWHADELEDEGLDPAALLQTEGFCVNPFHEELVEVADDSREQEEHGVLCNE